MDKEALRSELVNIIGGYLKSQGLELVDLICRYEGRDLCLRIFTDKPEGGVSLGECARLNKEIGALIDKQELIPDRFILEVSSPGLDRPLKSKADFLRSLNQKARFFLGEPVNSKLEWDGVILNADDHAVYINTGRDTLEIPLSKLNKAKQIIGFSLKGA